MQYTLAEMTDIHLFYGRAFGNAAEAQRLYIEAFPNRRIPCKKTFVRIDQRLRENGTFIPKRSDCGKPRNVRTPQFEERVLDMATEDPGTSTRRIAAAEGVSNSTVWEVLHEQQLYPYHLQRVQGLKPQDFQPRVTFCQWLLQKCAENPLFLSDILFTDEAGFTRHGVINFHNTHAWADENPNAIIESRHQNTFSINVWAGIIGDNLIGPHVLPNRLNGIAYRHFLENILDGLLDDVPYQTRINMWIMHDGAPAHFSATAREYLNERYPGRWIGRAGPTAWPPRSPDLNPLDYFLWGYLKSLVYATAVADVAEMELRVINACELIRNTPGIFERVRQSMMRRINACINTNGQHFEHLI